MAFLGAFTDGRLLINAVNLSAFTKSVSLPRSIEELDSTTFGNTSRRRLPGLADGSVDVEFVQDFGAGAVDETLRALVRAAPFAIAYRPTSGAISATNPELQFNAILLSYEPMSGTVGDLLMARASFGIDGDVTIDTTP